MRSYLTAVILGLAVQGACSTEPETPPLPAEYIRFKYQLSPGDRSSGDSAYVISLRAGSQFANCSRPDQRISIAGRRGALQLSLDLRGAGTKPAQFTARESTAGSVQLGVDFLNSDDGGFTEPASFSTVAAGFECLIRSQGADPFAQLQVTFSCEGTQGRFTVRLSEGEIRAIPCQS